MGETSAIEWCHATWNPVIGCAKVSPACTNCYAETYAAQRLGRPELWRGERHVTSASTWGLPERVDRKAGRDGVRIRLFVASLSDVFEVHDVWNGPVVLPPATETAPLRHHALRKLARLVNTDVLLLTKRPENVLRMVPPEWIDAWPAHMWVGTTVEDQQRADERLPHLCRIPARVRFVSYEPALGPVDFAPWLAERVTCQRCDGEGGGGEGPDVWECSRCEGEGYMSILVEDEDGAPYPGAIDWVIAGGESGAKARPSHPDWFRSVRDQCTRAGVPFLFKQWGEWAEIPDREWPSKVGKKAAGRLLDGVQHDGFPEVSP